VKTFDLIDQVRKAPTHKLAKELISAKRVLIARGGTEVSVKRFVDFVFKLRAKDRAGTKCL
jgi:hypothetical protein